MYIVQIFHGRNYDRMTLHSKERVLWALKAGVRKQVDKIIIDKGDQRATYRRNKGYSPVLTPQK